MTREEVMHDLQVLLDFYNEQTGAVPLCLAEAMAYINDMPRWIPVSERLPEEGKLVLLCFRFSKDSPHWRIQVGRLGNHDIEDHNFKKIGVAQVWYTVTCYWPFDKVAAWMSLPEPYNEEG